MESIEEVWMKQNRKDKKIKFYLQSLSLSEIAVSILLVGGGI